MSRSRGGTLILIENNKTTILKARELMTGDNIIDIVTGLVMSQKHSKKDGPWRIILPSGTDLLQKHGEYESLEDAIKKIDPSIKEVELGKGRGVSVEAME